MIDDETKTTETLSRRKLLTGLFGLGAATLLPAGAVLMSTTEAEAHRRRYRHKHCYWHRHRSRRYRHRHCYWHYR